VQHPVAPGWSGAGRPDARTGGRDGHSRQGLRHGLRLARGRRGLPGRGVL